MEFYDLRINGRFFKRYHDLLALQSKCLFLKKNELDYSVWRFQKRIYL